MTTQHRRWPEENATDELRFSQEFLQFLRHTAVGKVDELSPALPPRHRSPPRPGRRRSA